MNRHLHDPDLIAAYAEGLLDKVDEARHLVAGCAECRGEYELQLQVKQILSSLPSAELSDYERQRLHLALEGIGGTKVITLTDRRRAKAWMRVGSVAAGLFVLVGLGAVFLGMGGGASSVDNAFVTTAELLAGGDTTTAQAGSGTTAAATELSPLAGVESDDGRIFRRLAGGDADAVRSEIEELLEASRDLATGTAAMFVDEASRCLDELQGQDVITVAESNLDGRPILIYVVEGADGREALVYDQATCALVEVPEE